MALNKLNLYLEGNGNITLSVRGRRFRFAGSFSMPNTMLSGGGIIGGLVFLIGKAFGGW